METDKKFFNSSSCFVDLLYAKKYIDELKQRDKIKIDENDVKMLANHSKPYWLSMQNQCTVISFDGHNIVSAYFPGFTVKCGNCFMGKCEVIKIPYRPSNNININKNNMLTTLLGSV